MSSARKIAANRLNGRKGRGPRTANGKARASQNARTHGLSVPNKQDPSLVRYIAKAICGDDDNSLLFEQALLIAENDLLLDSIAAQRTNAVERLRDPTRVPFANGDKSLQIARQVFEERKLAYEEYCQLVTRLEREGKKVFQFIEVERTNPDAPRVVFEMLKDRDEFEASNEAARSQHQRPVPQVAWRSTTHLVHLVRPVPTTPHL